MDVTHRCMPQISICRSPETEPPEPLETRTLVLRRIFDEGQPQYLLRDRDRIYGNEVRSRISSLQIEEVLTAPRSPWQNPYVERLIGSIRRDCLDHFIIFNARHLKRTLSSYFTYCHGSRTHLGLDKQCPHVRQVSNVGTIFADSEGCRSAFRTDVDLPDSAPWWPAS